MAWVDVTHELVRTWALPPPGEAKDERGRLVVVGGSSATPGAVLLAAESGMRAGAGKVQVLTTASTAAHLGVALPEALVLGLPEDRDGELHADALTGPEPSALLEKASAVLVGPGIRSPERGAELAGATLKAASCPIVIDALATAISSDWPPAPLQPVVLTVNPTELAHCACVASPVATDDLATTARDVAERTGVIVAVGAAVTFVAEPGGAGWRDDVGHSGLAVAGSGDVRAGLTAGLLARGAEPAQAAVWGSRVHGMAGERLADSVGPVGFLAREIAGCVPSVLAQLGASASGG